MTKISNTDSLISKDELSLVVLYLLTTSVLAYNPGYFKTETLRSILQAKESIEANILKMQADTDIDEVVQYLFKCSTSSNFSTINKNNYFLH